MFCGKYQWIQSHWYYFLCYGVFGKPSSMEVGMLNTFTKQYSLSKTLRFELRLVGETEDYLENFKSKYLKTVVEVDERRSADYLIVKEIIDDYHRDYIEKKLSLPVDRKFCLGRPMNFYCFIFYSHFPIYRKIDKLVPGWYYILHAT